MISLVLGDIIYTKANTYIYIGSKDEICEEEYDKVFYIKDLIKDKHYLSYFILLNGKVKVEKIEDTLIHIKELCIRGIYMDFMETYTKVGQIANLKPYLLKRKLLGDEVPDLNGLENEKTLVDRYTKQLKALETEYPKLTTITQGSIVREGKHKFIYLGIHRIMLYDTRVVLMKLNMQEMWQTDLKMFEKNFDVVEIKNEKVSELYIDYASI